WPSRFSTKPFFRSFVVATGRKLLCRSVRPPVRHVRRVGLPHGPHDGRFLTAAGENAGGAIAHDHRVLEAHATAAHGIPSPLHGDGHTYRQCTGHGVRPIRRLTPPGAPPAGSAPRTTPPVIPGCSW